MIRNLTNRTVILTDIKAEIGPYKILDLERITERYRIDSSVCLQNAIQNHTLQVVKQTSIQVPVQHKEIHHHVAPGIDEERMKNMIREVMNEQVNRNNNIEQTVADAVSRSVGPIMETIRDKINNVQIQMPQQGMQDSGPQIDPARLAEITQRSLESIKIEGQSPVKAKERIKIVNNAQKIADELD